VKRRILTSVVVAVVVAVVGGLAASWSFVRAGATVFRITKTAAGNSQWTPDKPMFVLLLGSDLRPGAGCGCSDAIHVVGIPAGGGQATFINVPRDSRIDVPGHGLMKLTEAMSVGGEQLTTQAISEWMGLPITYTIVTTFDGLAGMVDELGGVTVNVPERIDDRSPRCTSTPVRCRWTATWRSGSPGAVTSTAATTTAPRTRRC
jgi:anionic cell wall polymer biosynthesis LytR-Cps2A-Psr (LCP) family protein